MFLLFDIGGTNMRMAVSSGKKLEDCMVVATPKKFSDAPEVFKAFAAGRKFKKVVGGIRGRLDKKKTKTLDRVILKDWTGKPLVPRLKAVLKAPVTLENDADLAGLGESQYGAGKGKKIVAYFTISSGVGGVRIVDGRIDRNSSGFEPGKQIINFDGKAKLLEDYISGAAIKKQFKKEPQEVSTKFYRQAAKILAVGLHNSIVHWSPEVMVLGGGMMNAIEIGKVRAEAYRLLSPQKPLIKKASLGDLSGLYGAQAVAKNL